MACFTATWSGSAQKIIPTLATPTTTHSDALSTTCTITESQYLGNETWQPEQGGGAAESLLFFLSLPSSHKRKHSPCMWCQWHRVHYLACHHTSPPTTPASPFPLKACQTLLGCHSEQSHDPDIQGFDLFSKWQRSKTAMFARRRCVFLRHLLDLACTERQIEHLSQEAMRVEHIYRCIYSFIYSSPGISNPWSISMNPSKI